MDNRKLDGLYFKDGKDITWFVVSLVSDVAALIAEREKVPFPRAVTKLCSSKTFELIEDLETGLWSESPEYVLDFYYERG